MEHIFNSLIIFGAKYLLIVIAVIAFLYFIRQSRDTKKQILAFGLIIFPIVFLAARIVALFYYDPRPFVDGHIIPLLPHEPDNGFPSDHTLLSGAIAGTILYFNRKIGLILFSLAVLVGVARVLAGVHHVVDIIGSIIIVLAIYFLVSRSLLPIALRSKIFKRYFS